MEVSGQLHSPVALPPEKEARRLGGSQSRSGRSSGEEEDPWPNRELNPGRPGRSLGITWMWYY
jgi:hypothetical protein